MSNRTTSSVSERNVTDKSDVHATNSQTTSSTVAVANVQEQMTSLDTLIVQLREEADRLLASANARTTVATLERAAQLEIDTDGSDGAPAADFPVFGSQADESYLPKHELEGAGTPPSTDAEPGAHADEDATVIAFPAVPEPKSPFNTDEVPDAEAAFGALLDATAIGDATPDSALDEPAQPSNDLAAIETHGGTEMPVDWNDESDGSTFDKFFSDEIEPEPAQRWLLNE